MRFVIFIAYEPGGWADADAATQQQYVDDHAAFERFVESHGRRHESAALADAADATTIRRAGRAELAVSAGPFAELTEQIGGYYDIELPDLETAVAAARLLPHQYTLEIRPVVDVAAASQERAT